MKTLTTLDNPALPKLTGRALELFWSASAEFEQAENLAERGNHGYAEIFAALLAEVEQDIRGGDQRLILSGVRVVLDSCRHVRLGVNAQFRLLAEIGLGLEAMEGLEIAALAPQSRE